MSTPSIHFELGNLTRADGSAVAAVGDSSVQVAVHGPGDVPLHKELLEEAAIEVVFKDAARSKDVTPEDKEVQAFVRGIVQSAIRVDLYPKTLIQIVVQELESDRPHLSLALNCICAALLDSGICMRMTFAATAVAVLPSGKVLLHPAAHQLTDSSSLLTVVFDSCSNHVLAVRQQGGPLPRDRIRLCVEAGLTDCDHIFRTLTSAVKRGE